MRVLLADDHRLVRAGLRALLDAMHGVKVVAEVDDGLEAERLIAELKPDVALLDIAMPRLSGIAVLRKFGDKSRTRIVLLSMYDTEAYVLEAVRNGAAGYLVKDSAVGELGQALAAVGQGHTYFSPRVAGTLARAMAGGSAAGPVLTGRQTEILRMVALGRSSKEIAQQLDLSIKTVETHRAQIMDRVGVRDLAGLVRHALRIGLIVDED